MAEEIVGKKMSEYASVDTLTGEEKATYLGNALVTSIGSKTVGGSLENYNVPLSEIGGSSLPDTSGKLEGDVLTLNSSKEPIWQTPQGGGGGSMSIVVIDNPTIESGNIVINTQNNTIYDVILPNGGYGDIQINPPTVASGEVIDFYVNLQNNESDENNHYTWVNNMRRISDASDEGIYSTVEQYKLLFIHGFYKYYTLKTVSTE